MNAGRSKQVRCAIYTRVSTDQGLEQTSTEGPHHQPGAHLPEASPAGVSPDVLFVDRGPRGALPSGGPRISPLRVAGDATPSGPHPDPYERIVRIVHRSSEVHGAQNFAGKGNRSLDRVGGIIR